MVTVRDLESIAKEDLEEFISKNVPEFSNPDEITSILKRMDDEGRLKPILDELDEIAGSDGILAVMNILKCQGILSAMKLALIHSEAAIHVYMARHDDADLLELMAVRHVQNMSIVGDAIGEALKDIIEDSEGENPEEDGEMEK